MKVLLLADSNSSHTIKWVKALSKKGVNLLVFGLQELNHTLYNELSNVQCYSLNQNLSKKEGAWSKLSYLKALPLIKKIIREEKPNLVHAHYASSYGLLGALSGFQPFVLSVWGSDVFSFPKKSILHSNILKYNLSKANEILSTSKTMALECGKYTHKNIHITPFGVDLQKFTMKASENTSCIVGTVKALEEKYGIDLLIKAFAKLSDKHANVELHLVGEGEEKDALLRLSKELKIEHLVKFVGRVENDKVPEILHDFTVFAALSRCEESFGVAIVEAQSCGTPVVVSRMGGLTEVVQDGETGLVVANENIDEAASAIDLLLENKALRTKLSLQARARVEKEYNWDKNVETLLDIYTKLSS